MKNTDFLRQTEIEGNFHQSTCLARHVKRNSSGKRKIICVRNSDLYKERKIVREGISEGKKKSFIFLILS